ncbi:MAG: PAS domain S-box protein, partial [Terriglobales bacterium]
NDPHVSDWAWAAREGMVGFAGYPLLVNERLVGVMAMFARHPFTEVSVQALAAVANEIALGIERSRNEGALRLTQLSVDRAAEAVFWIAPGGRLRYVNETACRSLGYGRDELLARTMRDLDPAYPGAPWPETGREVPPTATWTFESTFRSKAGRVFPVEWTVASLPLQNNGLVCAQASDITARKRSERYLKARHALSLVVSQRLAPAELLPRVLQAIAENFGWNLGVFWVAGQTPEVRQCDAVWCGPAADLGEIASRLHGAVLPRGCGPTGHAWRTAEPAWGSLGPDEPSPACEVLRRAGLCGSVALPVICGGDVLGVLEFFYLTPFEPDDELGQMLADWGAQIGQCLHQTRAEEQIREQVALLDLAPDGIVVRDLEDRVRYWNRGAERLYGWTSAEALGRDIKTLIYQGGDMDQFTAAKRELLSRAAWHGELRQYAKGGAPVTVDSRWTLLADADGRPERILVINTDNSERKRLESQALRTQRMEAIGTLASGISHDLNNILAPILMSVEILRHLPPDEECQSILTTVETSARRGADIVKQLLIFGRGVEGQRGAVQLRHLMKDMVSIIRETFPKDITITQQCGKDLWAVTGDPTQLHQVLLNLCVNARDAMPSGGRLSIDAQNREIDASFAAMIPDGNPGAYVLLTVTDTGSGIPPHIIEKIWEPFFTTKAVGKGTGLGLSTVLGIVRSHQGFVRVHSEAAKGSRFEIYLPASPAASAPEPQPEDLATPHG